MISRGHREGGRLGTVKNFKTPFFKDIENYFHEVIKMGQEPRHFLNYLK